MSKISNLSLSDVFFQAHTKTRFRPVGELTMLPDPLVHCKGGTFSIYPSHRRFRRLDLGAYGASILFYAPPNKIPGYAYMGQICVYPVIACKCAQTENSDLTYCPEKVEIHTASYNLSFTMQCLIDFQVFVYNIRLSFVATCAVKCF